MSTLYVVGAPQGDPADLTLRAARILGQVAFVVAEDVGRAQRLLAHHQIATPLSGAGDHPKIADGGDVALLLSGSSPGVTAPGQRLVQAALQQGLSVVPVPGPALPITALVISGLPADGFVYLGQLPSHIVERRNLLASVASERRTLVIQEKAGHLLNALSDLQPALGSRPLCIVAPSDMERNAVYRGILDEASTIPLQARADDLCVLVIGGWREKKVRWTEEQVHAEIQARLAAGQPAKEIGRALATESGWPRREIYRLAVVSTPRAVNEEPAPDD